jgi:D-serine deaminase-like pyridoxal phosphate-dependent protein
VTTIHDIRTPALLLDLDVLDTNLSAMADKARTLTVALRPHIKTHKCIEIAQRQRGLGARGITTSTLYEATVFADHGFDDITWAFPVIPSRIADAQRLAERIRLNLVVDTLEAVALLEETSFPFFVWLKVDCGYHRAGVDPNNASALDIAARLAQSRTLRFGGILSHSGHAYHGRARAEVIAAANEERDVMVGFASRLQASGVAVPDISVGSTPSMQVVEHLNGVTEARPGNYALFDFSQVALGSCQPGSCAVTVMTTVVSSQTHADHCIVDAGALALSKDTGPPEPDGPTMGEIFDDYDAGVLERDCRLIALSQEHGRVNRALPFGSRLRILPNHSCLTVAQFDWFYVTQGEQIVDSWRIWRGRD